ncbi:RbsD/FucU domain-containing protein [Pedobacter nyackensis]|uniref:D-ribose pyranase n=1 Tax=Pedobacter nyackensis TaxID=475255 RepID=A0A1W2EI78_9SPHI|nr:RbsD/FucU domain-containing protein [Pedobacter nyackensis]SMD09162.1 D-ribose pyranose/furanose isomerase RbsD [Pedobacter nyackensis]
MRYLVDTLKKMLTVLLFSTLVMLAGCQESGVKTVENTGNTDRNWKEQFNQKLSMLGHRNWILVVDKAFPEQNAPGMEYIYVNEGLLPVLKEVLKQINLSTHVKPIIYQDKELGFITENQANGVEQFVQESKTIFGNQTVYTMLHDSVFRKLDSESKLFKVLIIKTNETIPYTSVFLQLDCNYWSGEKERQLRDTLNAK